MPEHEINIPETTWIHPAIDFTANHAYVGQLLPNPAVDVHPRAILYLIRDDRRIFQESELNTLSIFLQSTNLPIRQRWSSTGINRYLNRRETISPNEIFQRILETLSTYIELPDDRFYTFLTLWNIGTYFSQLFVTYPYVYIGGISGSGKTELLLACQALSFNSKLIGNMSPSTLYRYIQAGRCSLFIDEEDTATNDQRSTIRNLLLNGYKKGGQVHRSIRLDDDWIPESFEIYGPKMMANIEGLEEVLSNRCIPIILLRSTNTEITNRSVNITDTRWQEIRNQLYHLLLQNWNSVKQIYLELPNVTGISGRNWELWKPILTLAKFIDGEESHQLHDEMSELALEIIERNNRMSERLEDIVVPVLLLTVTHDSYYFLRELRQLVQARLNDGNWLTSRKLGNILRNLGFNQSRRMAAGFQYFLRVSAVQDCARRLGISLAGENDGTSEHSEHSEHTTTEEAETEAGIVEPEEVIS